MADSGGRPKSAEMFERGSRILVGGVDSPVRAFRAVGGTPLVIERAEGARLYDVDGREYIDYVCSWGALILGHAHPDVVRAVGKQAKLGTSYGMTSPLEIELAERIAKALPSIERMRFVSSGTEATMSAVRLARGFTKRDLILKFEGGYHGHSDSFLVEAGSGLATLGISSSPGVPEALAKLTLNAPYNDAEVVEKIFKQHAGKIAAVIVEPVAANMGVVAPVRGFLERLRELTKRDRALLILDEVITGFRSAHGGAQRLFGIEPDLTTMGKIIGGGLPVAAYGGRAEIMEMVAPLGPVYQAGTLSGNPLAMWAGLATLPKLAAAGFYEDLNRKAGRLAEGFAGGVEGKRRGWERECCGFVDDDVFYGWCGDGLFGGAKRSDTKMYAAFFGEMLSRGVFIAPSQFEALFVSAAHSDADIERTIGAAGESLRAIAI